MIRLTTVRTSAVDIKRMSLIASDIKQVRSVVRFGPKGLLSDPRSTILESLRARLSPAREQFPEFHASAKTK